LQSFDALTIDSLEESVEGLHIRNEAWGSRTAALFFLVLGRPKLVDNLGEGRHLLYVEFISIFGVNGNTDFA
jgi:hypothetical protein